MRLRGPADGFKGRAKFAVGEKAPTQADGRRPTLWVEVDRLSEGVQGRFGVAGLEKTEAEGGVGERNGGPSSHRLAVLLMAEFQSPQSDQALAMSSRTLQVSGFRCFASLSSASAPRLAQASGRVPSETWPYASSGRSRMGRRKVSAASTT